MDYIFIHLRSNSCTIARTKMRYVSTKSTSVKCLPMILTTVKNHIIKKEDRWKNNIILISKPECFVHLLFDTCLQGTTYNNSNLFSFASTITYKPRHR